MAVDTQSLTFSSTITDPEFQAVNQMIENVFQSGGFTRTADTGQFTASSEAFPGSNSTYAGYAIRAFTDTLQATKPVVVKIEYGRGATATQYALRITIGTGSDGSGTITGILKTLTFSNAIYSANTYPYCSVSADTNGFVIRFSSAAGTADNFFFSLERTQDATADTGEGFMYMSYLTATSVFNAQFVPFSGSLPTIETQPSCLPPYGQTTGLNSDGNVAVYPFYFFGIGETKFPSRRIVGAFTPDFTYLNTYTVNVIGVSQIMKYTSGGSTYTFSRGGVPSECKMMMKYQ